MPSMLGTVIVVLIVAGVVALSIRSLWKDHKSGGGCTGNCATCGGCGHADACQTKK